MDVEVSRQRCDHEIGAGSLQSEHLERDERRRLHSGILQKRLYEAGKGDKGVCQFREQL
jgi:hypothetical protein